MLTMKQIVITYDDSTADHKLNIASAGFTEAEVLVILMETQNNVKDAIVNSMKKKSSPILSPHMMHPPRNGA